MAESQIIPCVRFDDAQICRIFENLQEIWKEAETSIIARCGPGVVVTELDEFVEPNKYNIISVDLIISRIYQSHGYSHSTTAYSICYERFANTKEETYSLWNNFFKINLISPDHDNDFTNWVAAHKDEFISTIESIQKFTPEYDDGSNKSQSFDELLSATKQIFIQQMDRVEKSSRLLDEQRKSLELEFQERRRSQEEAFARKEQELDRKLTELDRSSHKSERRRLFDIVTNQKSQIIRKDSVSFDNKVGRLCVVVIGLLCALILSYISFYAIHEISSLSSLKDSNPIALQYLILKSIFSGLGAAGSFAYVASWIKSNVNKDIEYAQQVNGFNADMVRASWAIETILEVQQEYNTTVPDMLITGMVNNLFSSKSQKPKDDEAALALKALLGFSGKASFGPEGARFEVDKKDARRISDGAEGEKSN